jgi:hypothetical protein
MAINKMHFQSYIQNLPISNIFKEQILDKKFIERNPVYYQKYPSLFANAFLINTEQIELLDIAGYLYYQGTIFTDSLIDEKEVSKFPLITICQEESIKILTSIYGLENNFWSLWNKRKNEYLQAIYFEKELSKKEIVTIEEYEVLADKKAAFGKVAIDCLFSINNINEDLYNQLLQSHRYFSVAFQLNDDIQDFKDDLVKGQFNWAIYLLNQQNITTQDPDILEKYLYIRGISKQIYLLGIDYCNKALNVVENIDIPNWKKVLNDTKKRFTTAIIEVDNYLEILTAEINLSNDKFSENNLQKSILAATNFIKSKQQQNGSWREYVNQGGISNTWATAFITSKISEVENLKSEFKNEIINALDYLKQSTIKTLWSYNTTWIEDADSTNFVFLSYLLNDKEISPSVIEKWLLFQNQNGSFSTYFDENQLKTALDDSNIKDVKGWLSVHNCVSAVSFYFLALQNQQSNSFVKIKKYFDENFDNVPNSYWWTSEIYTLYYLAKSYLFLNEIDKVNTIINKIKFLQNDNGSFSDNYSENLFYTGLALELLLLEENEYVIDQVNKTINYLLQNQIIDGSWQNSNALQVPNSEDIILTKTYFPIATFGMNVRAKEFNRLFTTTAILQSLSIYEQRYNSTTF